MPELALSAGVRRDWLPVVALIRDSALWVIPALLPLSTLLYTFSHSEARAGAGSAAASLAAERLPVVTIPEITLLTEGLALLTDDEQLETGHLAECEYCGWSNTYSSAKSASQALREHGLHCSEKQSAKLDLSSVVASAAGD